MTGTEALFISRLRVGLGPGLSGMLERLRILLMYCSRMLYTPLKLLSTLRLPFVLAGVMALACTVWFWPLAPKEPLRREKLLLLPRLSTS